MEYEITGNALPVLICKLKQGESLFTQRGGMGWLTPHFKMSTNIKGGVIRGVARRFMQESFFMTTYKCVCQEGLITFPSNFPGSIVSFDLKPGESIIAQKGAFLCAESSVKLSLHFKPKLLVGFFGGEGFIMQKLTGPGKVFLEIDGSSIKHYLERGECLYVDPGHVAIMEQSVGIKMKIIKGVMNMFFSGEGFFLTELMGPGEVWLQTMPIRNVARSIAPYLHINPKKIKNKGSEEYYEVDT